MVDPIKNILICLDHTETDEDLMTFARFIIKTSQTVEQVKVINILKNFHLPKEVLKEFPNIEKDAIRQRRQDFQQVLEKHLGDKDVETEIIIKTGSGLKNVLKVIERDQIDLVLIGKKPANEGDGVLTQRMGRRCPVTMLIIPHGSSAKISEDDEVYRILVPVDFSKYAALAVERAVDIARKYENTEVHVQHVYSVPTGYHYAGKTRREFARIMQQNAEKELKRFLKSIDKEDVKVVEEYTLDDNENKVQDIHLYAKEINAAGIIFGSKGLTATRAYFLGSTAEKLIKIDTEFPLMVVRRAGDYQGIMDLIHKI